LYMEYIFLGEGNMSKEQGNLSSVHNAIRVLKEFTQKESELGISELSIRLGLAKSTVFRLVKTLSDNHLIEQNKKTHKYHLGIAAFELGFMIYHENQLRAKAIPYLEKLVRSVRKTVHLGVYDLGGVVYLCKVILDDDHQGTITKIGKRAPSYCTSAGKILLAYQNEDEISRVMEEAEVFTPKTVTTVDGLYEQIEDVKRKGFVISHDEMTEGISSVAVPVFNDDKEVIAAISLAGPSGHFYSSQVNKYIEEMKMYSRLITEQMNFD
jgi:IclR family KDG regulon transcriptional repressor